MIDSLSLPNHNLNVINFSRIYNGKFLHSFLAHLDEYKLTDIKLRNKDIKKLLYHNIIHALCEEVLRIKSNEKVVIFYNTNSLPKTDLNKYVSEEELIIFIELLLRKITRLLPIKIFITSYSFEYFVHLMKRNDAKGVEILFNIKAFIEKANYERFTFQKIRIFSQKYGLTFLSNIYFNAIKSKQLLLK